MESKIRQEALKEKDNKKGLTLGNSVDLKNISFQTLDNVYDKTESSQTGKEGLAKRDKSIDMNFIEAGHIHVRLAVIVENDTFLRQKQEPFLNEEAIGLFTV